MSSHNSGQNQLNHQINKISLSNETPQYYSSQKSSHLMMHQIDHHSQQNPNDGERRKFERERNFQLQQKRLSEMSLSGKSPSGLTSSGTGDSADSFIKNILQKVDTDAKMTRHVKSHNYAASVTNAPNVTSAISGINSGISSISASIPYSSMPMSSSMSSSSVFHSQFGQSQTTIPQHVSVTSLMSSYQQSNHANWSNVSQYQTYPHQTMSMPNASPNVANVPITVPSSLLSQTQNLAENSISYAGYYLNTQTAPAVNEKPSSIIVNNNQSDISKSQTAKSSPNMSSSRSSLPLWCNTYDTPQLYRQIWQNVRITGIRDMYLCDTTKLYPILLSSGLSRDLLAQLWTMVNQTIPGQLTEQELYIALALIGLIQQNCQNPMKDVYTIERPPLPYLQMIPNLSQLNISQLHTEEPKNIPTFVETDSKAIPLNVDNDDDADDDGDDDFSDFKSAEFVTNDSKAEIPNLNEDFDDFKSALPIDEQNHEQRSEENPKHENVIQEIPKTQSLTEALLSNITALTPNVSASKPLSEIAVPENAEFNPNWASFESNPSISVSTSSAPMAPNADRYSVFKELHLEENKTNASVSDEFGDFLSHAVNSDTKSVDSLQLTSQNYETDNRTDTAESIRYQVIQCCRQLLHKAFNILLVNHGKDSVIEALTTDEGKSFILDLLEVYGVAKRTIYNSHSSSSNLSNVNLSDNKNDDISLQRLITDIDNTWTALSNIFTNASIELNLKEVLNCDENSMTLMRTQSYCAICQSMAKSASSSADQISSSLTNVLAFGGYEYHSSCANLWINCIHVALPQPQLCHNQHMR